MKITKYRSVENILEGKQFQQCENFLTIEGGTLFSRPFSQENSRL